MGDNRRQRFDKLYDEVQEKGIESCDIALDAQRISEDNLEFRLIMPGTDVTPASLAVFTVDSFYPDDYHWEDKYAEIMREFGENPLVYFMEDKRLSPELSPFAGCYVLSGMHEYVRGLQDEGIEVRSVGDLTLVQDDNILDINQQRALMVLRKNLRNNEGYPLFTGFHTFIDLEKSGTEF